MGDDEQTALEVAEEVLQQVQRVDVEVVGGLVEDEEVGVFEQRDEQVELPLLAAAEVVVVGVLQTVRESEMV